MNVTYNNKPAIMQRNGRLVLGDTGGLRFQFTALDIENNELYGTESVNIKSVSTEIITEIPTDFNALKKYGVNINNIFEGEYKVEVGKIGGYYNYSGSNNPTRLLYQEVDQNGNAISELKSTNLASTNAIVEAHPQTPKIRYFADRGQYNITTLAGNSVNVEILPPVNGDPENDFYYGEGTGKLTSVTLTRKTAEIKIGQKSDCEECESMRITLSVPNSYDLISGKASADTHQIVCATTENIAFIAVAATSEQTSIPDIKIEMLGADGTVLKTIEAKDVPVKSNISTIIYGIGKPFTVTFMANSEVWETAQVNRGDAVSIPSIPTSKDKYFNGWYTGENGTGEKIFDSTDYYYPTKSIVLYAYFTETVIVGIKGLSYSSSDGSLTFTDAIRDVGTYTITTEGDYASVTNPLSKYFPFDKIEEFTDEEGNVFVKFPQLWMKWEDDKNGNIDGYKFANYNAGEGYFIPDAFLDPKDTANDRYLPYFALGKYEMSGTLEKGFSKSGQTYLNCGNSSGAINAARGYGNEANFYKGYQPLDFAQWVLYNLMCMMYYKTWYIKKVFKPAVKDQTDNPIITGTCDNVIGMNGWNTSTGGVKMLGIENPYGNIEKVCVGVNFSGKTIYAQRYPQNYGTNGNAMEFERPVVSSGRVSKFKHGTSDKTCSYMYISEVDSSYDDAKDGYDIDGTASSEVKTGGLFYRSDVGLWTTYSSDSSTVWAYCSTRLSYRPV